VIVRASTDADVPAIAEFYRASVVHEAASWEYEPPSVAEFASRRAAILLAGYPYLVADLEGRPAGFAYASSYRSRPGYRFAVEDSVYVDPSLKGCGIGRALLGALVETCAAQGFRHMIAVIGDSANVASIRLHEACGFTTIGVFPAIGYKFGRWFDSVQMLRPLGKGAADAPHKEPLR
jgi:phosphinothricin acetyltransferase